MIWPDGKVREFLYEDARFPWAVTGEIHEDGVRFSTYVYDADGLATETYTGNKQNHFKATWATKPVLQTTSVKDPSTGLFRRSRAWVAGTGAAITSPLGEAIVLESQSILGTIRITSRSQPAGSGCTAANSETGYDARGNIISAKDFAGRRSCMAYDTVRPLETLRLEGVTAATCPDNLATYTIPANLKPEEPQRLIHTQWHPMWAKPVRVAEPKRITTTVYNGQPDPLNAGAVANCVPAGAMLPVGEALGSTTPLAVVCKRYEQATNDATGQLGFTAAETGRRSWSYTYNARGQVTKATDPVGQVSDYTYFEADDFSGTAQSELGNSWATTWGPQHRQHHRQWGEANHHAHPLQPLGPSAAQCAAQWQR
ncbi:hypothetical protein [Ideonella paludis]|uniref:hypothetical protein n=1 Tax=Ideonella paludis TaxID=1233411 RepID=UPI0036264215